MTDDVADADGVDADADADSFESHDGETATAGQTDGETDAPAETSSGADTEAGSSTGAEAEPDMEAESDRETDPDTEAESGGETESDAETDSDTETDPDFEPDIPKDVQKYARFKKVDGAQYDRVNDFLRERTYVTAREWAIARLCADFRTETGVEMTKIGENLPELVPFMTDTYTPQAVNQARSAFRDKVRKSGATFLYGAMSGFFTAEELDEMMYEVTEIAKFLLEVEGVDLSVEEELEAEERISSVMREVREASTELRKDELSDD
ncbi:hypothetical protein C453_18415 [Haloferax elongans ATCC BAA-1513]|uniref:Uncharacterized protein n=1 Tax=Haloferax elongans ATCC BAA-1513 TaxID=1230453 RepID=M0HAX1_HALEO|nr:DUF5806 family protein [Haloferax elongans]ELZ80938.1 hypothetical protein C453_18415 [Haloferax elongans ATCC BAA-1513]